MAVETEVTPYGLHSEKAPSALSAEERTALQGFCEKYREQIANADALPQPMRSIAQFVKKEGGGAEEDERG